MVYTERAEMAAVSCGTSHASAVSTPLRWIFEKRAIKKLFTHVESHASAVSLLESGVQRYIKAINNNNNCIDYIVLYYSVEEEEEEEAGGGAGEEEKEEEKEEDEDEEEDTR